jgi:outer membrane receptor protein involved in Fe transport
MGVAQPFTLNNRVVLTGGLRGLTVGGGMRLRVGRVAGAIPTYEYVSDDVTDRWNGRQISSVRLIEATDQALFDFQISYRRKLWAKYDWTLQLNIDNVLDADDFIVNNTHSRTGAPTTYRYQDPRRFILTNSFTF